MTDGFDSIRRAAARAALPEVAETTWYRTPALAVRGRSFTRLREPGVAVLMCPLEDKEMLLAAAPAIWFETDHYRGWPAILVRLDAICEADLARRLAVAWAQKAPNRLVKAYVFPEV